MNVHLHIERLVLDGLSVRQDQGAHVRRAVEQELTRLLGAGHPVRAALVGHDTPRLQTPDIHVTRDLGPAALGTQIAGVVLGRLVR